VRLSGVGLALDEAFRRNLDGAAAQLREVDLDPFYAGRSQPIRIDLPDASADAIYALEIFEHFISPLGFLAECARLLKPGAVLCLSTPNVSSLGAIYQLLRGRSNYEALDASPMYQPDSSWRGHSRIYAKDELITLCGRFGLDLVAHAYYHEAGARYLSIAHQHPIRTAARRWIGALVPHLCDDQFAVFRRRSGDAAAAAPT
jgi:SAM-dependent methyltransferase